jgi:hypothetical protein
LEKLPHPTTHVSDFNSHNQAWGYEHNDIDGNRLMEWMTLYNMHLIYHPKDIGTFRSARWQKIICTRSPKPKGIKHMSVYNKDESS